MHLIMGENVHEQCWGERKKRRGGEREREREREPRGKAGREGEGERRKRERGGESAEAGVN